MTSSEQLDRYKSKTALLTLARWQTSTEIGWRSGEEFRLIQWGNLPTRVVWPLVKRLADKGRSPSRIQRILNWLEDRQ